MRRQWLKERREKRGLSQVEFARVLGVSRLTIQYWERGMRNPSSLQRAAIAEHLGSDLLSKFSAEDRVRLHAPKEEAS